MTYSSLFNEYNSLINNSIENYHILVTNFFEASLFSTCYRAPKETRIQEWV